MDQPEQYVEQIKQLLQHLQEDELQHPGSSSAGRLENTSPQLQINFESSACRCSFENNTTSSITLKSLPGRGTGVVATNLIPAGSIVLQEDATLNLADLPSGNTTLEGLPNLLSAYFSLSPAIRQRVLSLHSYTRPDEDEVIRKLLPIGSGNFDFTEPQVNFVLRLRSIYVVNRFESIPGMSSLYLDASRINHSCIPNCEYGHAPENQNTITICSSRDILPDEEITIPYLDVYEPVHRRRAQLKRSWGFECNCAACDVADPTVDTGAHEQELAEYDILTRDSSLEVCLGLTENAPSLEDFDEGLRRSARRCQIAQALGDASVMLREHLVSSRICKKKWLQTGDEEDLENQIRFLELGQLLAGRIPPSPTGKVMKEDVEKFLHEAKTAKGIE